MMIILQEMQISIKSFSLYFFLLIILLIVLALIVKRNVKKEDKKTSIFSWIEMKDVLYWLFMVCLVTIIVLTYKYSNNEAALNHWSFAGTIVSIILAVVAIGFTLFQTLASNLSSQKIEVAADKIEKASSGLDSSELEKAGKVINNVSENILNHNERLMNQVHKLNEEIKSFKTEHSTQYTKLNQMLSNSYGSNGETQENQLVSLSKDEFIERFFKKIPKFHRFYLYSLLRFTEENIPITNKLIRQFTNEHAEAIHSEDGEEKILLMAGANFAALLGVRSYVKFIGISIDKDSMNFPKEYQAVMSDIGLEIITKTDSQSIEFLEQFITDELNEV